MKKDPTRAALTDPARALLAHLWAHHRGADAACPYRALRAELAEQGYEVTERDMYDLVSALVMAGRLVGTTSAHGGGAFVVVTARDARIAYRNLYGRVSKMARRCRRFKASVREALSRQQYLALRGGEQGTLFETAESRT